MWLYNILFSSSVGYFNAILLSADKLIYSHSLASTSVERIRSLTIALCCKVCIVEALCIDTCLNTSCQYFVNIVRRNMTIRAVITQSYNNMRLQV